MAKEYLDKSGLNYFWSKIKAYVDAHLGVAAYYQKNEGTHITTNASETTIAIPIATYSSKDMLFVDINGLDLIGGTDYTISGSNIVLTTPITTPGTIVHFVAIRGVTADPSDYASLKGDPGNVQDVLVNGNSVVNGSGIAQITRFTPTVKYAQLTSNKSVPDGTGTMLTSISLEKGIWVVNCGVRWATNNSGWRRINLTTTSGAIDIQNTVAPVQSEYTQMNHTRILEVASTTTYYLNGYQNSGSAINALGASGTNYGTYITAVRIA